MIISKTITTKILFYLVWVEFHILFIHRKAYQIFKKRNFSLHCIADTPVIRLKFQQCRWVFFFKHFKAVLALFMQSYNNYSMYKMRLSNDKIITEAFSIFFALCEKAILERSSLTFKELLNEQIHSRADI